MSDDKPIVEIGETYLLPQGTTVHDITEAVSRVTENKAPRGWWICFLPSVSLLGLMTAVIAYLLAMGIGVWGNNAPAYWGWDITNFVWWIGIGHAGTLISAILFLFRQKWRTSINRFAEAMTVMAVLCAAMFPACTPAVRGSTTTCSPSRTRWTCGRTSSRRSCGTCSP
jgi:hypothetical protein